MEEEEEHHTLSSLPGACNVYTRREGESERWGSSTEGMGEEEKGGKRVGKEGNKEERWMDKDRRLREVRDLARNNVRKEQGRPAGMRKR